MLVNKNIFITGATGFIGEKLAFRLGEKNKVYALVRPKSAKKSARLKEKGIEIILGDLLDSNSYSTRLNGIDYVFHLAALFNVDAQKEELYQHNVLGTKIILETCLGKDIAKIIYFSTAYIAGTKEKDFISEEEPYPRRFKNWYEWSKAGGEKIACALYKKYSLPIVVMRPAIVYGPGSIYGFYNALSLVSEGKPLVLPGNGKDKVHLVHVDDVVSAAIHLALLENNIGEIYHICDSSPLSCAELIRIACCQLDIKPPLIALPGFIINLIRRLPISKLLYSNISPKLLDYFLYNQTYANTKLRATGFRFRYPSPVEGLKTTISWYCENRFLTKG